MGSEDKRQWLHLGVGAFALLLHWLTKWEAAGFATLAILFNIFLLGRLFPEVMRENEGKINFFRGTLAYPFVVLIMILIIPWSKKELVAGAWVILAAGDSFSNMVGRRFGWTKLFWNRKKTYAGMVGFILFALPACVLIIKWTNPQLPWQVLWIRSSYAVLAGAVAETIPWKLDDNFSVAFASLSVLYIMSL